MSTKRFLIIGGGILAVALLFIVTFSASPTRVAAPSSSVAAQTNSVAPLPTTIVPNCADLARAGQTMLDTRAKRDASSDAVDQAITDHYKNNTDWQLVIDARDAHDALGHQFTATQIAWSIATGRASACVDLITAEKNVETANELVAHNSAGAADKLASAQQQWHELYAAAVQ